MAKRGGSGNDLKSQLGSFFRSTLQQLDTVREVVTQKSKAGRLQIDLALLRRKRKAALADLGEVVAKLCAEGRLDEDEFPELGSPLARVESLDEQIDSAERKARRAAFGVGDRDDRIDDEVVAGGPDPAPPVGGAARARSRPSIDEEPRRRARGEDEEPELPDEDDDREEYFDDEPPDGHEAPRGASDDEDAPPADDDDDGRYDPVDEDAEDADLDDDEPTPPPRPRK